MKDTVTLTIMFYVTSFRQCSTAGFTNYTLKYMDFVHVNHILHYSADIHHKHSSLLLSRQQSASVSSIKHFLTP
jgi:hypothetical protein